MKKANRTQKRKPGGIPCRTNHKGFSLVELIVVVAIMAVLVGVLAPQYLRYVEKTRIQKDNSALAEIGEAVRLAILSNEDVYEEISHGVISLWAKRDGDGNQVLDLRCENLGGTCPLSSYPNLAKELEATVGTSFTTQSKLYRDVSGGLIALHAKIDSNGQIKVWYSNYRNNNGQYQSIYF